MSYLYLEVPRIYLPSLSAEEKQATWNTSNLLNMLAFYVSNFRAALSLYDASLAGYQKTRMGSGQLPGPLTNNTSVRMQYASWMQVAGRDGAMTIWHFSKTLENIAPSLHSCPTLQKLVDHTKLRLARRQFGGWFPFSDNIRNTVAHAAEMKMQSERGQHDFSGDYESAEIVIKQSTSIHISGALMGRNFAATYDKKIVSYEISQATLEKLEAVARRCFSAFAKAEEETKKITRPMNPDISRQP